MKDKIKGLIVEWLTTFEDNDHPGNFATVYSDDILTIDGDFNVELLAQHIAKGISH